MFKNNKKVVGLVTAFVIGFLLLQQVSPLANECFAHIDDDDVRVGIKSIIRPKESK